MAIHKKNLSDAERESIVNIFREKRHRLGGTLQKGFISKTAAAYNVNKKTMSRIWSIARKQIQLQTVINVKSKRWGKKRRPKKEINNTIVSQIPLKQRTNIRRLVKALQMGKTTVHKALKRGELRSHSNAIKPYLTEENKRNRLRSPLPICLNLTVVRLRHRSSPLPSSY
ncbi:unnamed protein product [Cuscuta europaea]|uniref:Transposase Tc1-like domain-containing protein n=1 Tax=Cuscuta europaea TaxID=41803 RepID=A0A9P0YPY9_CUSEU|nr:unnamed protein product [Cuscuta europaea]